MMNEKEFNNENNTLEKQEGMNCEGGVCKVDFGSLLEEVSNENRNSTEENTVGVAEKNNIEATVEYIAEENVDSNKETSIEKPSNAVCKDGVCTIDWGKEEEVEEEVKNESETLKEDNSDKEENDDNMSMQDLMDKYDKIIRPGQVIKGKIIQLDEKEAIIALLGAGNDGKLPVAEVSFEDGEKLTDRFKIGDEVEAKVIRRPMESDSFYILSMKEMYREESKRVLLNLLNKEETIKVKVKEVVKGGLVALYKGNRIFIPASLVDVRPVRNLEELVAKEIDVNIIEAEEKRGSLRIVGSRKLHLEKSLAVKSEETWNTLEVGQIVKGTVERITDFGAFINVNGVDGLLHISEISYGKTPKPSNIFKAGEEIEVKVINVDKESKKLSLSLKALKEDPWTNIDNKYPNNTIVLGKVVRFTDFGAFIELEPGIDGLVHISQISHERIEKPSDVLKIGEEVKVMILDSNEEAKKVSLSIKAVEE